MEVLISDYNKYELSSRELLMVCTGGYLAIFTVSLLFYHSILLAMAMGLLTVYLPVPFSKYKAEKRKELLVMQFRDLLYSLAASFASGRQMKQALIESYNALILIYDENTPMMAELRYMLHGMIENRENEEDLLVDFAARSHQEDIRNFVDVYRACRITGGDMEKVIANASSVLMDKMTIEREINALTSQKKFEGRIISVMPLLVVLCLNIFSPDYLAVMYETFTGRVIMTIALGGIAVSYRLMMKMTEISV